MPRALTQQLTQQLTQVTQVTGMILTEARAAGHAVAATMAESSRAAAAEWFLAAQLARMAIAAQDAAAAAERGDATMLRRQLRRSDTLVSAMWAVLTALRQRPPVSRQRPHRFACPRPAATTVPPRQPGGPAGCH